MRNVHDTLAGGKTAWDHDAPWAPRKWEFAGAGTLLVADWDEVESCGSISYFHAQRFKSKKIVVIKRSGLHRFPCAGGSLTQSGKCGLRILAVRLVRWNEMTQSATTWQTKRAPIHLTSSRTLRATREHFWRDHLPSSRFLKPLLFQFFKSTLMPRGKQKPPLSHPLVLFRWCWNWSVSSTATRACFLGHV